MGAGEYGHLERKNHVNSQRKSLKQAKNRSIPKSSGYQQTIKPAIGPVEHRQVRQHPATHKISAEESQVNDSTVTSVNINIISPLAQPSKQTS